MPCSSLMKKGVKFTTYATWLINREIRHYLKDKLPLSKLPGSDSLIEKIDQYVENTIVNTKSSLLWNRLPMY